MLDIKASEEYFCVVFSITSELASNLTLLRGDIMKKNIIIIFSTTLIFLSFTFITSSVAETSSKLKGFDIIGNIPDATQSQKDKIYSLLKSGMTWGDIVATDNTINDEQKKHVLGAMSKATGKNIEGKELDDLYDTFKKSCEKDVKAKAEKKAQEEKNKADWAELRIIAANTLKAEKEKETFVPKDTSVKATNKAGTSQTSNSPSTTSSSKTQNNIEAVGMVTTGKIPVSKTGSNTAATSSTSSTSSSSTSNCSSSVDGLFGTLLCSATELFVGMRSIVFAVSGFGIMAVAIGGFFGQLNWKWLSSIIIGLFVISTTSALINYMVDSEVIKPAMITDTLVGAD